MKRVVKIVASGSWPWAVAYALCSSSLCLRVTSCAIGHDKHRGGTPIEASKKKQGSHLEPPRHLELHLTTTTTTTTHSTPARETSRPHLALGEQ